MAGGNARAGSARAGSKARGPVGPASVFLLLLPAAARPYVPVYEYVCVCDRARVLPAAESLHLFRRFRCYFEIPNLSLKRDCMIRGC